MCVCVCVYIYIYIYSVLCIYMEYVSETAKPQLRFYCPDFAYVASSVKKGALFFFNRGAHDREFMCESRTNFTLLEMVKNNHCRTETKRTFVGLWFSLDHSFRLSVWLSR